MENSTKAAIVAAFLAGGAASQGVSVLTQPDVMIEVVNHKIVKLPVLDGGTVWYARTCADQKIGDRPQTEECWEGQLPDFVVEPINAAMLKQK